MTRQDRTDQDIIALETAYWEAMKAKDGTATARLSSDPTLVADRSGVRAIPRNRMGAMTESGDWRLLSYRLEDLTLSHPTPDVAVIAYVVEETVEMGGKAHSFRAADLSVWVRAPSAGQEGWTCAAHSETLLGPSG